MSGVKNRVFGNRTLGLFECQVPETHCNVQLGSRRKSLDARVNYSATAKLDVEALPVGVTATALNILQNGRPDILLSPQIYYKVSQACSQAVEKLTGTDKTVFDRSQILKACQNMLDSSEIEVPLQPTGTSGRRLEVCFFFFLSYDKNNFNITTKPIKTELYLDINRNV